MKYRALSQSGDYQFGRAGAFLVDSPAAVVQSIKTRLALWTGEWFLDDREGTPYETAILGYGTQGIRDQLIKERISQTPGVTDIVAYTSIADKDRKMVVEATVNTAFGSAQFATGV